MAFVTVTGTVERLFNGGFRVVESWQQGGYERHRRWAVFPKEPVQVAEGQTVKVSGALGAKVATDRDGSEHVFTGRDGVERHSVDLTVGSAKVDASEQPQQHAQCANAGAPVSSPQGWGNAPQNGGWGGVPKNDQDIPF